MQSRKRMLLSTTMVPLIVFAGVIVGGAILVAGPSAKPALAQCAPKKKVNPCAAAKTNPCAAATCNPCAAACNPCNPCAAAKCNPCNPCAAAACSPCSPCGAGKICVVPRLQAAAACNPCAAAKCNPCSPCNPCAAAKCNPCNPCAVAKCNPCNPCAAATCNPCNPCAAAKCNPCNPCAAATCNPCNPCAAAKCNPCNPCAAAKCNPCSPCSPCSPCNPCNPCNPCAAGGAELSDAEAVAAYDCVLNELKAAYAKSGNDIAVSYANWSRYSKQSYQSGTHGGRYVQNYANAKARAYGAYEKSGPMPSGAVLAKDSFAVKPNGRISVGPLFLMEKMNAGFNVDSGNWRYTMIMPNGSVFGTTGGVGGAKMRFCAECHLSLAPDSDSMLFMPEAYRVR